jgi:hypothetical protein
MTIYRIKFQTVNQTALKKYNNADPLYFRHTRQTVPNSQILDEDWHDVTTPETDNPWQQYNQLREWSDADKEFIRNVRLEKMANEAEWESVDEP